MTRLAHKSTWQTDKIEAVFSLAMALDGLTSGSAVCLKCLRKYTMRCAIRMYLRAISIFIHFHFAVVVHFSIFYSFIIFSVFVFHSFFFSFSFLCQIEFMLNSALVRRFCAILPRDIIVIHTYYVRMALMRVVCWLYSPFVTYMDNCA